MCVFRDSVYAGDSCTDGGTHAYVDGGYSLCRAPWPRNSVVNCIVWGERYRFKHSLDVVRFRGGAFDSCQRVDAFFGDVRICDCSQLSRHILEHTFDLFQDFAQLMFAEFGIQHVQECGHLSESFTPQTLE